MKLNQTLINRLGIISFLGLWALLPATASSQTDFEAQLSFQYGRSGFEESTLWNNRNLPISLRPTLKSKINDNHFFKISPSLRWDSLTKEPTEKFQFTWNDSYYQLKFSASRIRLGYQNIVWEGTDFSNPLDLIMQKNLSNPLDSSSISSPSLGFLHEVGSFQFDLYFLPEVTPARLPGDKSPWWPRTQGLHLETSEYRVVVPDGIEYQVVSPEEVNNSRKSNWGGRIQYKSDYFDSSLVLHDGLSNSPFVLLDLLDTSAINLNPLILRVNSPVRLRPLLYRAQSAGLMFAIPVGSHLFRLGGNSIRPMKEAPGVPEGSSSQVVAWEKNFDLKRGPLTTLLQYHQNQSPQSGQLSSFQSLFTKAVAAGLRITLNEETHLVLGHVYDLKGLSSLTKFDLNRRLFESYEIGIYGVDIQGSSETLLGLYDSYDSYGIKFTGYF